MIKDNKSNKWTRFVSELSFKGMTLNNRAVLEYIASKHHSDGVELTFRDTGDAVDITKHSARRNVRKMESIGLIKTKNQEGIVRKIKDYIEFLDNNQEFITTYVNVGDKISISKRRCN